MYTLTKGDVAWMKLIKAAVKDVTFIQHLTENAKDYIFVKLKNESGGRDSVKFLIEKPEEALTLPDWNFILKVLEEKSYVTVPDIQ